MNKEELLDNVAMDLISIPPLIHRTIKKKLGSSPPMAKLEKDISQPQFEIIRLLGEHGELHIAEICKKLEITKAHMTQLLDKLVEMKLVERRQNTKDRRILDVSLTSHGKKIMEKHVGKTKEAIKKNMATLSNDEIEKMSEMLRGLHDILVKLS